MNNHQNNNPNTSLEQARVQVAGGVIEGCINVSSEVRIFKGVPFARPPVGDLRWQPPQLAESWEGVRKAEAFGARPMQQRMFDDMVFRSNRMSEDCLYLNVWTPARSNEEKLPVLVYFYGGGFIAGDSSEGRYDGQSMAEKGIVMVTVNYRLGVFGFYAHPELTKESPHRGSGNYGLLDQHAALVWVYENIAAFGGDPKRITIAGESAGSISVSAHMVSPLSKQMIAGGIGESGSILGTLPAVPLAEGESRGVELATKLCGGKESALSMLRKIPSEKLLHEAADAGFLWFNPTVDGYFLPADPLELYKAGKHVQVPLLAGVNSEEAPSGEVLGDSPPTVENYRRALERLYPGQVDEVFGEYSATTESEVVDAAQDLAGDRFISHGTWKWVELAAMISGAPAYYYRYCRRRPPMRPGGNRNAAASPSPANYRVLKTRGAVHSAEIEYALGNLDHNRVYAWTSDDYAVSERMQQYFADFIKTGDPNGGRLPQWPQFIEGRLLAIDVETCSQDIDQLKRRYRLLDRLGSG